VEFPPGYEGPNILFEHVAGKPAGYVRKVSEYAHPVLRGEGGGGSIVAFTHTYGEGRVYWQSFIDGGPNYPQLSEYFAWAVRWVVHIPPEGSAVEGTSYSEATPQRPGGQPPRKMKTSSTIYWTS